jgi:hypothetical protein
MIGLAMVHTAILERHESDNYNGTVSYKEPETIKCYKEEKFQRIVSTRGEDVISSSHYYTIEKISTDDAIDGKPVLSVDSYNMLGCKYYRSYV